MLMPLCHAYAITRFHTLMLSIIADVDCHDDGLYFSPHCFSPLATIFHAFCCCRVFR